VESISGIRPEVQAAIAAAVDHCVTQTDLPLPNKRVVSSSSWCQQQQQQQLARVTINPLSPVSQPWVTQLWQHCCSHTAQLSCSSRTPAITDVFPVKQREVAPVEQDPYITAACTAVCTQHFKPSDRLPSPALACLRPHSCRTLPFNPGSYPSVCMLCAVPSCVLQGKVRDTYELDDKIVIVTTDRYVILGGPRGLGGRGGLRGGVYPVKAVHSAAKCSISAFSSLACTQVQLGDASQPPSWVLFTLLEQLQLPHPLHPSSTALVLRLRLLLLLLSCGAGRVRLTACLRPSPSRARCSTRQQPGGSTTHSTSYPMQCWQCLTPTSQS